jgi:predicted dehydrogenase
VENGKLQVGVVGVGGIGFDQHLPGWAKVPFAQVAALADLSAAALERAGEQFAVRRRFQDWQELVALEDLDAVDVCTPNRTHTPIALAALQHGKHVLCEKPLAASAAEVRTLAGVARETGRLLMTAQHLRFDPLCQQLKAMIDAGTVGEIYYSRAQWLRRRLLPARPTFTARALSGGGAVLDIGVHVLDLACWFMGNPEPVSVSALADRKLAQRPDISGSWGDWDHQNIDVEDFAAGFVRFASGAALTLEASWLGFQPERELRRIQCFGTLAGFSWPDGLIVGETARTPWERRLSAVAKSPPHHEEILQFARAVRDDLPSPVPVEESLKVVRILDAFYRSVALKKEVLVD